MKNKLLEHFQNNYCVKVGHPTAAGKAATNLIYYIVISKTSDKGRGDISDDEWVKNVLIEIGEKYTSESHILTIQTSNEFIKSIVG